MEKTTPYPLPYHDAEPVEITKRELIDLLHFARLAGQMEAAGLVEIAELDTPYEPEMFAEDAYRIMQQYTAPLPEDAADDWKKRLYAADQYRRDLEQFIINAIEKEWKI